MEPEEDAGRVAGRVVVLADDAESLDPPTLWEPPYVGWIEAGVLDDQPLAEAIARSHGTDFYAFLTTAGANALHLAGRLVAAVARVHPLPDEVRDDIELALHEAISNAVVHGNLQVEGMKGLSVAALDRFSSDLAARLADPGFAMRQLEVTARLEAGRLVLEVADEGSGFTREDRGPAGASGRGLELIAAIAEAYELLDGGRRIRMRFAL